MANLVKSLLLSLILIAVMGDFERAYGQVGQDVDDTVEGATTAMPRVLHRVPRWVCMYNCNDRYGPFCNQFGKKHQNECWFTQAQCEAAKRRVYLKLVYPIRNENDRDWVCPPTHVTTTTESSAGLLKSNRTEEEKARRPLPIWTSTVALSEKVMRDVFHILYTMRYRLFN